MLEDIIKNSNKDLEGIFTKIDEIEEYNSSKVLDAFIRNSISESDFNSTTGYGYNDTGRDKIERVFADILKLKLLWLDVSLYQELMLLLLVSLVF